MFWVLGFGFPGFAASPLLTSYNMTVGLLAIGDIPAALTAVLSVFTGVLGSANHIQATFIAVLFSIFH